MSGAAQAQVDWLQRTDQNFNSSMEVLAFAKAGGNVNGQFETIVACRPMAVGTSCPIVGTWYRNESLIPLDNAGFNRTISVSDSWTHQLYGSHQATTVASQQTVLDPWWMRASGRITMDYSASGAVKRHHGLAHSVGRLHFTVRGNQNDRAQRLYFVAHGAFTKPTAKTALTRGWLMFYPKTAGGTNTYWGVNVDLKSTRTEIRQYGVLMPGLYTLDFGISDEPDLSNRERIDNGYEFEITFGRCDAQDSRLTHGNAALPSRSMDEAAQRALAEAWTQTRRGQSGILPGQPRDREWGGMIYETAPGSGEFRYTRPFQGGDGMMSAAELTTSFERVAALGLCAGQIFQLVGVYHTHPEETAMVNRIGPIAVDGSHLSVGDINFAVRKGQETGRPFSIYARGHNGDTCGIHKYTTTRGHVHLDSPPNATPEQLESLQTNDVRRATAVWIPLSPARRPEFPCTPNGRPVR